MSEEVLAQGNIKWFSTTKGFGFIQLPDGGLDIFMHADQLRKSGFVNHPQPGEKVKFCINQGPKGSFATNISRIEEVKNAG